jgi:hypothetical protein
MKLKVKNEETRYVVLDKEDNVISVLSKTTVEESGGLEKCVERYKKLNPKNEIEIV